MIDRAPEPCANGETLLELLPPAAVVDEAVTLLKGLADPTRLKILILLSEGEVCVYRLVEALDMSQSAVSHQLRVLRGARLVVGRKEGQHVHYRLADAHVLELLRSALAHGEEAL